MDEGTVLSGEPREVHDPRLLPELAAMSIPMKEVIESENIRGLLGSVKKILRRILKGS
jgi:hypothetical protein